MTVQITVALPEDVYQHFQWLAQVTETKVEDLMAESLAHYTPNFDPQIYVPVEQLSDNEVMALAHLQMDEAQGKRLSELSAKRQHEGLTRAENTELWALLHVYQVELVRKSIGLREAVQRGLMKPLEP